MSTVLLNTLTGKTSAGSIVVTGEGGSTTTNMQNGLAKAWVNFDHSTGKFSYSLTNAMAGLGYSQSGCCRGGTDGRILTRDTGNDTASVIGVETTNDDGSLNDNPHDVQIVGDLA